MDFYIIRVLFPALFLDIALTINFLRANARSPNAQNASDAFLGAAVYFLASLVWMSIYSGDPRFQGQGAIGLAVFLGLGLFFSFLRLILGLLLYISAKKD